MFESLDDFAPLSLEVFYFAGGLFLLVLALIFLVAKVSSDRTAGFLSWPLAAAMCVAPYLALFPFPRFDQEIALVGALVGGVALVWCYLQCVFVYSRLGREQVVKYVLVSFLLASIIRIPLEMLPLPVAVALVSPLPFVCVVLCGRALRYLRERTEPVRTEPARPLPVTPTPATPRSAPARAMPVAMPSPSVPLARSTGGFARLIPVAAEVVVYGLVLGIIYSNGDSRYEIAVVIAHLVFRTVFPLVILWFLISRNRPVSINLLFLCALLFIITALAALSLLGEAEKVVTAITVCARTAIIMLLWLVLAMLARSSARHPYLIFGLGWALYITAIAAGMVFADALNLRGRLSENSRLWRRRIFSRLQDAL
jgi:hypothetical protein